MTKAKKLDMMDYNDNFEVRNNGLIDRCTVSSNRRNASLRAKAVEVIWRLLLFKARPFNVQRSSPEPNKCN